MATTDELQKQIDDLYRLVKLLASNSTIPNEVGEAFKQRILEGAVGESVLDPDDFTIASVSEGDTVATPMDGFITLNLNGVVYNIPFYKP